MSLITSVTDLNRYGNLTSASLKNAHRATTLRCTSSKKRYGLFMMNTAILLFVVALIAAFLGFGAMAATAASAAKIVFIVALIMAVVSFFMSRTSNAP